MKGRTIQGFLERVVDRAGTLLMTDEWGGYNRFGKTANHAVIRHKEEYVNGIVHTNTIEGFWSLVKRAWYGQHHHYSEDYMPLYISEACYKYNHRRDNGGGFGSLIAQMVAA